MENYISKYMTGLSIMGATLDLAKDPTVAVFTIMGNYDKELSIALYGTKHRDGLKDATEEQVMADPGTVIALENLKNWLRSILQNAINEESKAYEAQMKRDYQALIAQQKESQKPHVQGTVSEIAAKFGISK